MFTNEGLISCLRAALYEEFEELSEREIAILYAAFAIYQKESEEY